MPVTFNCPACQRLIAAEVGPGAAVRCPLCNRIVTVTGSDVASPGAAATAPVHSYAPTQPVNTGLAVGAMVCGIIGLIGCWPVGVAGLVMGIVALVRTNREPARYGGKGMAIAGICTGGLGLVLVPLMISILLPSLSRARELSKRTVCAANMNALGRALYIYAQDNGMFPEEGADWQARLVNAALATPKHFQCPSDGPTSTCSYYYVPGYGTESPPNQIILYEDPAIHGGEGGNILYQDSHTAFVKSPQYEQLINSITLPDGTPWTPHEEEP